MQNPSKMREYLVKHMKMTAEQLEEWAALESDIACSNCGTVDYSAMQNGICRGCGCIRIERKQDAV